MREKAIAQKNAERVSPARVHGRLAAAPLGLIHDIVVHECGDMNEFDDYRKVEMARINLARCTAGQKGKKWSQTFAASAYGIGHIAFDRGIESRRLFRNAAFNFIEMRLDKPCYSSQRAERRSGCSRSRGTSPARS